MAGHSHWKNIKRQKAVVDAKRGRIWSKIARKIIIAAKRGGDPAANLTLRYVIDEAKAANMPKDTIQNAIKKGTGELGAENYDDINYEGYGPGGVAVIVEALTNNRTRTVAEVRRLFDIAGGNVGTTGSVAFQFTKQGILSIRTDAVAEDRLMELALEAGAEDVRSSEDGFEVITAPAAYHKVKDALTAAGITLEASDVMYVPNNTVAIEGDAAVKLVKLIDQLEENDDIQTVSHNAELPDGM